jgi:hypothetical protein
MASMASIDAGRASRDLGALELDPATGVYRPRHR